MAWTLILMAVLTVCFATVALRLQALMNQFSQQQSALRALQAKYDALVQSVQARANVSPATPRRDDKPRPFRARTFAQFRDAVESGALPAGMKERNDA